MRSGSWYGRAALLAVLLPLLGCTGGTRPGKTPPAPATVETTETGEELLTVLPKGEDIKVALQVVSLTDVKQKLEESRGKVVLLNFWADFWLACKEEFPHLVQMHRTYESAGLALISVNLDDPADEEVRTRVIDFLKSEKADFTNLAPANGENIDDWAEHWKVGAIPLNIVYNRKGEVVERIEGLEVEKLEKLIQQQVEKK